MGSDATLHDLKFSKTSLHQNDFLWNGFCLRLIYHFQLSIHSSRGPDNCILKSRLTRRSCAGRLPLFPDSDWLDDEDPSMPPWPDGLIPLAELQGSVELFVPSDRKMTTYIDANKCKGFFCLQVNTSRRQRIFFFKEELLFVLLFIQNICHDTGQSYQKCKFSLAQVRSSELCYIMLGYNPQCGKEVGSLIESIVNKRDSIHSTFSPQEF